MDGDYIPLMRVNSEQSAGATVHEGLNYTDHHTQQQHLTFDLSGFGNILVLAKITRVAIHVDLLLHVLNER